MIIMFLYKAKLVRIHVFTSECLAQIFFSVEHTLLLFFVFFYNRNHGKQTLHYISESWYLLELTCLITFYFILFCLKYNTNIFFTIRI